MGDLPRWVQKDRGDLYHSQYEVECEDHLLAIKLIGALQIAWDALEKIDEKSLVYHAKDAMKRIETWGKED